MLAGASGGLTVIEADAPTEGQLSQVSRQLAERGPKALEKSLRTLEKRLAEHQAKLQQIKDAAGHTSSVEREIKNFQQLIQAIKLTLGK